jgi:ubiquinone/menaquinone biosynthesis C-methylase UbiE
MVAIGSSKSSPLLRFNYVLGDVMAMPFPNDQFDTVLDTFGLEYVLNPRKALEEMRRYSTTHAEFANLTAKSYS